MEIAVAGNVGQKGLSWHPQLHLSLSTVTMETGLFGPHSFVLSLHVLSTSVKQSFTEWLLISHSVQLNCFLMDKWLKWETFKRQVKTK